MLNKGSVGVERKFDGIFFVAFPGRSSMVRREGAREKRIWDGERPSKEMRRGPGGRV